MWLQCGSEVGNNTSGLPSVSVNSHTSSVPPGEGRRTADGSFSGRSQSEELVCNCEIGQTSSVYFSYFVRFTLCCLRVCVFLPTFD